MKTPKICLAGIWPAEGLLGKAAKDEWEANLSGKKQFRDCSLVEADLTEI